MKNIIIEPKNVGWKREPSHNSISNITRRSGRITQDGFCPDPLQDPLIIWFYASDVTASTFFTLFQPIPQQTKKLATAAPVVR